MPCSALLESPCSSFSGGGTPHCRFPMAGRCSQGVAHRPLRLHSLRVSAVLSKDAPPSPSGPSGSDKRPFSSTPRDSGPSGAPSVGTQPPLADPALARQLNHLLRLPASATGALSTTAGDATTSSEPLGQQAPPGSSIPGPVAGPGAVYFFAYGTSLHRDALYDSGVRVLARDTAVVRDPAVQLVFRHRGGQATLMRMKGQEQPLFSPPGSRVHGVLYKIEEDQLRRLHKGLWGYELQQVEVQTYTGISVRALVMVSGHRALLPREVPPTEAYMRQLREGAADQVLDPAYQAWLSSIDTVSCAGLPMDYYATPSKHAWSVAAALGAAALLVAFLSQL